MWNLWTCWWRRLQEMFLGREVIPTRGRVSCLYPRKGDVECHDFPGTSNPRLQRDLTMHRKPCIEAKVWCAQQLPRVVGIWTRWYSPRKLELGAPEISALCVGRRTWEEWVRRAPSKWRKVQHRNRRGLSHNPFGDGWIEQSICRR